MSRGRVTAVVAACALATVLAACASPDTAPGPGPTTTPAGPTPSSEPPTDALPTAPATPTVPAPGPREDRLWSADILVQWDRSLPESKIREIQQLPGVAHTERIGLGQVSIQNRVLTIAAVDPGQYRLFTAAPVADLQEAWDRVAGGELALDKRLATRLVDEDGSITLGAAGIAPTVHVGAHAPQVPTIDLVVNSAWAPEIGMASDNGLLISTGLKAPAAIRKPLERIIGKHASVQMLDIASRLGLDPDATLTAVPTGGTLGSLVGTYSYRVVGGRVVPDATWVATHIRTEQVPILGSVTCHKDLFPQLRAALMEVVTSGLSAEIHPDEYAGCYYPRFIANTTTLSNHAFGLALDINVPGNLRGSTGEISRAVVAIFKKWGFAWGGDWRWTDPMHFELAQVKRPA